MAKMDKNTSCDNLGTPRTNERTLVSKHLIQPIPLEFNVRGIRLSNFFENWHPWHDRRVSRLASVIFFDGYSKSTF